MLHATFFDTQGNNVAQVLLRNQDIGPHDRLAHVFDGGQIRKLGRVVDVNRFTGFQRQLKNNRWRRGDQVQVVFALKALLDDLHVQHAQEPATEAEAQGVGAFRGVLQRRVVEGELLQRFAEIFEVVGADREQAGVNLRLDAFEAR
ncbi:hypothetical protein [Pseudomonas sp. 22 E 5]|nr:hypothetical protein [Pseudomonas sp. 22 E 5]